VGAWVRHAGRPESVAENSRRPEDEEPTRCDGIAADHCPAGGRQAGRKEAPKEESEEMNESLQQRLPFEARGGL